MSVPLSKTKHFQLTMHLREQVQAMQPGQVLPTFKELCELHRVSQATLERALDRLRAEGLLHRVEGTRRLVASTVCDPARHRVAIIRPDWPSLLFHNMVQAVADAGRSHDWAISLVHYRSLETLDITRAIDTADAAILIPTSEAWPEHFRRALYKPHRPVVVLQNIEADCPRPSICVNDQRVGELAVEHLAELGHRRIALLQDQPDTPSALARIAGWRSMLERMQLDLSSPLIDCRVSPGEKPVDRAFAAMTEKLSQPIDFTALFCISDMGAMAALRALREMGHRVPQEVSVLAFADEGWMSPYLCPPLTSVEIDLGAYAKATVNCVEQHFQNPQESAASSIIQPRLVTRSSTAPAPAA